MRLRLTFPLVLVLIYGALDLAYRQIPDAFLSEQLYRWGINQVAADIINRLDGEAHVQVDAYRLLAPGVTLEIVRGCDGAGMLFLLTAAVLAFSAPWPRKLVGLLGAVLLVYALNELRILGLFYVLRRHPAWFDTLHVSIMPLIVLGIGAMAYVIWTAWAIGRREVVGET